MTNTPFFDTISELRSQEQIVIFNRILKIDPSDESKVNEFLKEEYSLESNEYPSNAPSYSAAAGIWSAKMVYIAAHLLIHREHSPENLPELFPKDEFEANESNILSVDICLRFLPPIIFQLKLINPEDKLIQILEKHLIKWHYSGIGYELENEELSFEKILSSNCLSILYCERVIDKRAVKLAKTEHVNRLINEQLGDYKKELSNGLI